MQKFQAKGGVATTDIILSPAANAPFINVVDDTNTSQFRITNGSGSTEFYGKAPTRLTDINTPKSNAKVVYAMYFNDIMFVFERNANASLSLYKSIDLGRTFAPITLPSGFNSTYVKDSVYDPISRKICVLCGSHIMIIDNFSSVTAYPFSGNILAIHNGTFYVVDGDRYTIYRINPTTGAPTVAHSPVATPVVGLVSNGNGLFYVSSNGDVYSSSNGTTFAKWKTASPLSPLGAAYRDGKFFLQCSKANNDYDLISTVDFSSFTTAINVPGGGATYFTMRSNSAIMSSFATVAKCCIISEDNGKTWTVLPADSKVTSCEYAITVDGALIYGSNTGGYVVRAGADVNTGPILQIKADGIYTAFPQPNNGNSFARKDYVDAIAVSAQKSAYDSLVLDGYSGTKVELKDSLNAIKGINLSTYLDKKVGGEVLQPISYKGTVFTTDDLLVNKGYVVQQFSTKSDLHNTNNKFLDYLPLAGGTLTGGLGITGPWPQIVFTENDRPISKTYILVSDADGIRLNEDTTDGKYIWSYSPVSDGIDLYKPYATSAGTAAGSLTRKDYVDSEIAKQKTTSDASYLSKTADDTTEGSIRSKKSITAGQSIAVEAETKIIAFEVSNTKKPYISIDYNYKAIEFTDDKGIDVYSGPLKERGARVYSPNNPPKLSDLNAAPAGFGIGEPAGASVPSDDCNKITKGGIYNIFNDTTNTPYSSGGPSGSMLLDLHWGVGTVGENQHQLFFNYEKDELTFRRQYGGTWKPWVKLYSTANKPTLVELGAAGPEDISAAGQAISSVYWMPSRSNPGVGGVPGDGQTVDRTMYPDLFKLVQDKKVPTCTDTEWLADPTKRGCYTLGDGSTTFRVPDYNGKWAGSLASTFQRGDGYNAAAVGIVQTDAIRNITGEFNIVGAGDFDWGSGQGNSSTVVGAFGRDGDVIRNLIGSHTATTRVDCVRTTFDASKVVPTAAENRPSNVAGCWVIKAAHKVQNLALIDAQSLSSKVAEIDSKLQQVNGSGTPVLAAHWVQLRTAMWAGFAPADGQLLSRTAFPDAWQAIVDKKVPTVAEVDWLREPQYRGCFTTGDGKTTFRVPDYNGKTDGSLGAAFMRGDGLNSVGTAGAIQGDAIRNITGTLAGVGTDVYSKETGSGPFNSVINAANGSLIGSSYAQYGTIYKGTFDASRAVPTAADNHPVNVTGCWAIKLFAAQLNQGSVNVASLQDRITELETKRTVKVPCKWDPTYGEGIFTRRGDVVIFRWTASKLLPTISSGQVMFDIPAGFKPSEDCVGIEVVSSAQSVQPNQQSRLVLHATDLVISDHIMPASAVSWFRLSMTWFTDDE